MRSAAFFDLDNTVVRGSSLFFLARQLVRDGIIGWRDMVRFAWFEVRFVATRSESRAHRDIVVTKALELVAGFTTQEVQRVTETVTSRLIRERLVPSVLQELRFHQRLGRSTYLVSASPIEVAADLAEKLGMTGAIATCPEVVGGAYTGRLIGEPMHGPRKAKAILQLARDTGIDLSESFAYSDSENDLPLLQLVGNASVVHANRRLREIAQASGWKILPSRSDEAATLDWVADFVTDSPSTVSLRAVS